MWAKRFIGVYVSACQRGSIKSSRDADVDDGLGIEKSFTAHSTNGG